MSGQARLRKDAVRGIQGAPFTLLVIARTYSALRQGGEREFHVVLRLLDRMTTHGFHVLPNSGQALGKAGTFGAP